jgi:hypothetical protein
MAAPVTFAELEKETQAQQDAYFTKTFGAYKGTVTAAWVKADPALAPYAGDSALAMYRALKTAFPGSTPLQRGATVYQAWIVNGVGTAIIDGLSAAGTALGDVATGIKTAQIVPSWSTGLAQFLADLASRSFWLRAVKVIAGVALVIIGVVQLTHATNIAAAAVKGAVIA